MYDWFRLKYFDQPDEVNKLSELLKIAWMVGRCDEESCATRMDQRDAEVALVPLPTAFEQFNEAH